MKRLAVAIAGLVACGDNVAVDKTAACRLGVATSAATLEDRRAIGVAPAYVPDLSLAARDAELGASMAARRAAAWQVVERVLAPVPLGDPRLADNFGGEQPRLPAWHAWYARDDFDRTFKHLYRGLGADGREARAPIDAEAGFAWNAQALDEVPEWPEQRYLDYLATISTQEIVDGVGGVARVGYSPGAMGHLLESYARLHRCRLDPVPEPFVPDAMREPVAVTETRTVELGACGWRVLGPFQAGAGEVRVTSRGDGDADIYVRRGAVPETDAFDCRSDGDASDEACSLDGGGPVYVAVFAAEGARVSVDVAYLASDVAQPACLGGPMPRDAVLVKAEWRRRFDGEMLPAYDTSAARMAQRLAGEATWEPDGEADPAPADIYTVQTSNGSRFRMPALHVMSKELDHWMWITLWYSTTPDADFGADRPASLAGPWRNYKMCVATDFVERDEDPRGGAAGTLGEAIAATHGGVGAPTWCSNPYLEQGRGNAGTNCIGCHQHGGTALAPEAILELAHHGATRQRNNFFTDYLWVIQGGMGEDLSAIVQAEVDFWDATDP
ncbi:MAG: PPC domain-containing protein [Deltaproteobacteria bacterium]|nr:PPC domain-containing protein [Deltaproteobacteria bacterium]